MSILNDSLLRLYNSKRITLDKLQGIYDRGSITKEDFYAITGQYPSEKPISDQATGEDYIKYCLPMLDEKYSVTVEADGYTGKSQTIMNDKTQEVEVDLVKIQ